MNAKTLTWIDAVYSPVVVSVGLAAMIVDTSVTPDSFFDVALVNIVIGAWLLLGLEVVARIRLAPHITAHDLTAQDMTAQDMSGPARARLDYLTSLHGVIDVAAILALPLGWLVMPGHVDAQLFAIVWALKYLQHSTGLEFLIRVALRVRTALFSIVTLFFVVFLGAATAAYLFERHAQPEAFGSVPRAMWWAIVTLTTTGYGDVVPTTLAGRVLAGWVMVGGIVVFALWAGIIANAFTEELRRRDFLRTWELVAQASFFQNLGAAAIADIVKLLHARDVAAGSVLFTKGQPGSAMYFIVSGEVRVELGPKSRTLAAGDFVGEMALLFGAKRSATVVVTQPSVLLVLDVANFRELAGRRPELISTIEAEAKRRQADNLVPINP